MKEQLREHLETLHSELSNTSSVDARSKQLLEEVLGDIRELLAQAEPPDGDEPHGLADRLREAAHSFEESHPALSTAVGRVVDTLTNLGI